MLNVVVTSWALSHCNKTRDDDTLIVFCTILVFRASEPPRKFKSRDGTVITVTGCVLYGWHTAIELLTSNRI